MKSLKEYCNITITEKMTQPDWATIEPIEGETKEEFKARVEAMLTAKKEEVDKYNEIQKKYWINLPYKTAIYNEGPKNKNFKITKAIMNNILHNAEHSQLYIEYKPNSEHEMNRNKIQVLSKHEGDLFLGYIFDLPADKITYKNIYDLEWLLDDNDNQSLDYVGDKLKKLDKDNLELTKVVKYEPYWSAGQVENRGQVEVLRMFKPYFKSGKLEVEMYDDTYEGRRVIHVRLMDKEFNKKRDELIKKLEDPKHIDDLKQGYDKKRAKELEAYNKKQAEIQAAKEKAEKERVENIKRQAEEERKLIDDLKKQGKTDEEIEKYIQDKIMADRYERWSQQNGGWMGD